VIESRWGARFSSPVQTGPGAHAASCTMGTGSFLEIKSGQGVTLTPHSHLVPLIMKEYSYTSTPLIEPQWLYKDALYLYLRFLITINKVIYFRILNVQVLRTNVDTFGCKNLLLKYNVDIFREHPDQ
jgi:hypothetical protein